MTASPSSLLPHVTSVSFEEAHTMLSKPLLPHTMLSSLRQLPQTMLSPPNRLPQTMLSPSELAQTMLSHVPQFEPHTTPEPPAVRAEPQTVLVAHAFAFGFT